MDELVFVAPRQVEWQERHPAELTPDGAIIRPTAVSTCDMDELALRGAVRFRGPAPLGHEGVGIVEAVGDDVTETAVGDRVIVPWQIACGICPRCLRGQDAHCMTVPPGSCFGWGPHIKHWRGLLTDRVVVPYADHLLVPVPDSVPDELASGLGDNIVDAWRTVGLPLAETSGDSVLVVGPDGGDGGSIGLYAAQIAVALGATSVVYASRSRPHARLAERIGVDAVLLDDERRGLPRSFDVTVDASASRDGLATALRATGPNGVCTSTSGALHRGDDTPLPVYEMYMNVVTFKTGWVHTRPNIPAPLELIADGLFDPLEIATTASWSDAVEAFAEPFTKLVLVR